MEPTETAQGYDDELGRSVDGKRDDELARSVDGKREVEPAEDDATADPLVELLVEEISIDGMCGVY